MISVASFFRRCASSQISRSHAPGTCSAARARGSIRFSLSIYNTEAEVDYVLKHLPGIIARLRASSPVEENIPALQ